MYRRDGLASARYPGRSSEGSGIGSGQGASSSRSLRLNPGTARRRAAARAATKIDAPPPENAAATEPEPAGLEGELGAGGATAFVPFGASAPPVPAPLANPRGACIVASESDRADQLSSRELPPRDRGERPSGGARLALPGSTAYAVAGNAVPAGIDVSAAGADAAGVDAARELVDRLADPVACMSGSTPPRACSLAPSSGDASSRTPAVNDSMTGAVVSRIGAAACTTGATTRATGSATVCTTGAAACVTGAVVCATGAVTWATGSATACTVGVTVSATGATACVRSLTAVATGSAPPPAGEPRPSDPRLCANADDAQSMESADVTTTATTSRRAKRRMPQLASMPLNGYSPRPSLGKPGRRCSPI